MNCTFFGHKEVFDEITPIIFSVLIDLIENRDVKLFFVGNQGNFDRIVLSVLKELKTKYSQIDYFVVLAYLPSKEKEFDNVDYNKTLYPDGLEYAPFKYAICNRNKWMINNSDYVVTYVRHCFGGASKFKELAQKKGKTVIEISEKMIQM